MKKVVFCLKSIEKISQEVSQLSEEERKSIAEIMKKNVSVKLFLKNQ